MKRIILAIAAIAAILGLAIPAQASNHLTGHAAMIARDHNRSSHSPHAVSAAAVARRSGPPCANGSGIPCYQIQTVHGNTDWQGFTNDSVGDFLKIRSDFSNARDFYLVQVASSCPGVSHCTEQHLLTASNLRVVATTCNGNFPINSPQIDLSTNSDQTGDVWYLYATNPTNGWYQLGSRRCENDPTGNYSQSTDEVGSDYISLNQTSGQFFTWSFAPANNP